MPHSTLAAVANNPAAHRDLAAHIPSAVPAHSTHLVAVDSLLVVDRRFDIGFGVGIGVGGSFVPGRRCSSRNGSWRRRWRCRLRLCGRVGEKGCWRRRLRCRLEGVDRLRCIFGRWTCC